MARERQNSALQVIFSFFLGLMVLAFIGVGVNTFYPQPRARYQDELDDLWREQERLDRTRSASGRLDPANEAAYDRTQERIDELTELQESQQRTWARNTSIVLILFATAVMSVSLIRSDQLRVISNGLLLGGLFTMVYGVGWVLFSGESIARFVVIVFAFVVTVALGYLKFVRERRPAEAGAPAVPAADAALLAELASRVERLEARTSDAAAALGESEGPGEREG